MLKFFLGVIVFLFIAAFFSDVSDTKSVIEKNRTYTVKAKYVACKEKSSLRKIISLHQEGDKEAGSKLTLTNLFSGECRMVNPGDKYYIRATSLNTFLLVRKEGDYLDYWTNDVAFLD
jgi:hypothetical protein